MTLSKAKAVLSSQNAHLGKLTTLINQSVPRVEDLDVLRSLLSRLDAAEARLQKAMSAVIEEMPDDDDPAIEAEHDSHLTMLDQVDSHKALLQQRIDKLSKTSLTLARATESPPPHSNTDPYSGLPQVSLPKFSGDLLAWRSFLRRFKLAVDSRPIPDVNKLGYLCSCLKDEPLNLVKGLSLIDQNYPVALEVLGRRYGDPNLLIGLYAERMTNLEAVSDNDVKGLRLLVDEFENSFREMQLLIADFFPSPQGPLPLSTPSKPLTSPSSSSSPTTPASPPLHNLLLAPLFSRKLPASSQLEWQRRTCTPSGRFDLEALITFARSEADSIEAIAQARSFSTCSDKALVRKKHQDGRPPPADRALLSTSSSCPACKEPVHSMFRCPVFMKMSSHDRHSFALKNKRCMNCLGPHFRAQCTSERKCSSCGASHNSLLHDHFVAPKTKSSLTATARLAESPPGRKLLKTGLLLLDGHPKPVRFMLDSGSEESFITSSLATKTRLVGHQQHRFEKFGGEVGPETTCGKHRVVLRSRHDDKTVELILKSVHTICNPSRPIDSRHLRQALRLPRSLPIAEIFDDKEKEIDILFGEDSIAAITDSTQKLLKVKDLLFYPTIFGYVIGGKTSDPTTNTSTLAGFCKALRVGTDPSAALWDLETLGIEPSESALAPVVTPSHDGERYQVPLPWIDSVRPNFSFPQALRRSHQKLPPPQRTEYSKVLEDYHELDILEPAERDGGSYIPHHGLHQKGKLRIVYDASAKPWRGPSLNTCLHPGPNLLSDLTKVLLQFRTFTVPLVADIEKAFLMVGVEEKDREFLKIVWKDTDDRERTSQFKRVCFGLNCGPYLLLETIRHHLAGLLHQYPHSVPRIEKGIYMDDLASGGDTPSDVLTLATEAKSIFKEAGMNLRAFVSSPKIHPHLSTDPLPEIHRVLGIPWLPPTDTLELRLQVGRARTKREALSQLAAVFDPLGLLAPWTIGLKLFVQSLWTKGGDWDDPLSPEDTQRWDTLRDPLPFTLQVPRLAPTNQTSELHVFCDASQQAYAAAVYLKTDRTPHLICAKARVAPLKPATLTVPRLELMAALVGARLAVFCAKALHLPHSSVSLYSDSMVTLGWITGSTTDVFVRNRVKEIRSLFEPSQWSWVSTGQNPADLPTRSCASISKEFWTHGPQFLTTTRTLNITTLITTPKVEPLEIEDTLRVKHSSSHTKSVRVTAWVKRFISNLRSSVSKALLSHGPLDSSELMKANVTLLRSCHEGTPEHKALSEGKDPSTSSPLWDARPLIDPQSGLIMCQPRHGGPPIPWLPLDSPLAPLIIFDTHRKLYHMGPPSTTSEILRSYWAPRLRSLVRRVLSNCGRCKRLQTRPFKSEEGSLPKFRCNQTRAFESTGLDHFGPPITKICPLEAQPAPTDQPLPLAQNPDPPKPSIRPEPSTRTKPKPSTRPKTRSDPPPPTTQTRRGRTIKPPSRFQD